MTKAQEALRRIVEMREQQAFEPAELSYRMFKVAQEAISAAPAELTDKEIMDISGAYEFNGADLPYEFVESVFIKCVRHCIAASRVKS